MITKDDIEFEYQNPGEPNPLANFKKLAERLLAEREAYREVAIRFDGARQITGWERPVRIDEEADAILRRSGGVK